MILRPVHNHDKEYGLLCNEETVVGRKDCGVLISNDPSISRVHAKLSVQTDGAVFITDMSKYGTLVNSKKLQKDQRHNLKEGDVIKFGNQPNKSEFRLHRRHLVVCFSNMNASQKAAAKSSATKLGAKVVDVWDNSCTHLIMTGIMVTVKVVNALSNLKPIVTPKWLEDGVTAVRGGKPIPDHADYLPEVTDPNCKENKTCFLPDESRSFLLSGKVFYFLTEKQYQRLKECINNGGGICKLAVSSGSLGSLDELVDDNAIVMSVDGNSLSSLDNSRKQWIQETLSFVKSKGYRAVVDSEVGFALLSVSIEKHCNPLSHQVVDPLPPPSLSQQPVPTSNSLGNVTVYASETQLTEPSTSNRTMATPKSTTKEPCNSSVKIKSDDEGNDENDISISLSVPTAPPRATPSVSNLSQSASRYYEPPEAPMSSGTSQAPVRGSDDEGKIPPAVPSPDGLSCSPSTFRSSLPTATDTSVLVPGTFTEKTNKEQNAKTVSKLFTTRKRKLLSDEDEAADSTSHDVVDLTQDEELRPKTTATSAANSVNIYSVLKKQKRDAELAKAEKARLDMEKAKAEKARLDMEKAKAEKANAITRSKPTSSSSAVIDITDNLDAERDKGTPVKPMSSTSASHHSAIMSQGMSQNVSQEVEAMDSDSQRPTLSRFRRFAERYSNTRKSNGYLSARVKSTTKVIAPNESTNDLDDILPVAPPVVCEAVSLVVVRCVAAAAGLVDELSSENGGPVNFKKFKKARYIGMGALPTIIGGADLVRFNEEMSTLTQEWQYEREHEMDNGEDAADNDTDLFKLPDDRPR